MIGEAPRPLTGIRVIDQTTLLPGPVCTGILADFGAEVIKVESPKTGDPLRAWPNNDFPYDPAFGALNRNKGSVVIDLRQAEGREAMLKLVKTADVLVEQFRPGVMERLGLGYEALQEINPRLIYCSITGYGQTGPYRDLAGHDLNYVGYAGVLGVMGTPAPLGAQVADVAGGGLMGCIGILLALQERERSGRGQYVDMGMMDGALGTIMPPVSRYLATRNVPVPGGEKLSGGLPWYSVYETADGRWMTFGALEPKFWATFCQAVERPDWIPLQSSTGEAREKLRGEITALFLTKTLAQWTAQLAQLDTCVGPVLRLEEALEDPQVRARELVVDAPALGGGTLGMIGIPIKLSRTPGRIETPAPPLGQDTVRLLQEIGYSPDQIENLKSRGVVE